MIKMSIHELNKEQYNNAIKLIIKELKAVGIVLDENNAGDRQKAWALAANLRIRFNENGYLG